MAKSNKLFEFFAFDQLNASTMNIYSLLVTEIKNQLEQIPELIIDVTNDNTHEFYIYVILTKCRFIISHVTISHIFYEDGYIIYHGDYIVSMDINNPALLKHIINAVGRDVHTYKSLPKRTL